MVFAMACSKKDREIMPAVVFQALDAGQAMLRFFDFLP
jgi:hypothetical protein